MLETLRSYWSIISTIITVVAVPAVGYLYKKYKQADARQKAVELGVQALLRDRIVQSYYHYEERGWIPSPGDYIFYDWQDGNNYATTNNTGSADHVGIVVSCDGKTIKVVEGNMSDAVGYRKLAVNGRYIRGFGVPKYASKATSAPSGGGEASTPGKDEKPTPGLAVGSVVTFTGTKHYISSMAVNGKSCKPGEAKVTAVAKSGKHPYHLIKTTGSSSTVYGWVDAADVKEVVPAIVKGSRVKVAKGAKTYNGGSLASYVYTTTYTVIQIDGSRVVIGINGVVTAAVNIKDLTLVG